MTTGHALRSATLLFTALLAACSDASRLEPTAPEAARGGETTRRIEMLDACDPLSFNAVLGQGACTRPGGLSFDTFIAQLTAKGVVDAWRFAPGSNVQARVGQELLAINRGGETHTFTEVEEFGGGIVPLLNQLSGNTEVAPECNPATLTFIPPGGTYSDEVEEPGTEHYQCCIHPWMRATVTARGR